MDDLEHRRARKLSVKREQLRPLDIVRQRIVPIYLALLFFLIAEFIAAGIGFDMQFPILLTILIILSTSLAISIADRWSERS